MKRTILVTAATAITVGLMTGVLIANAQQISAGDPNLKVNGSPVLTAATSGGLSGTIVSASESNGVVYTTPSTGSFVLTSFCVEGPANAVVTGSTFGRIVRGASECIRYEPGLAMPKDEAISVGSISGLAYLTITGVLQP